MKRIILAIFDLLAPLIRLLGADYSQFRAILEAKLILDTRRVGTGMAAASAQPDKKSRNTLAGALMVYTFMGFMLVGPLTLASPLVSMTLVNTWVMLMISLSLIGDFSSVLLDSTDNAILQPRPVSGRTVLLARVAHITTYLTLLSLSLSLIALIVGSIRIHPLFALVYLGTLCCTIALVVSVANILYLLAMQLTTPERLRDLITYFQMGMMIVMVGAFQILPRLAQTADWKFVDISATTWIYFFPPAWMAGPIDWLAGHGGRPQQILTALALVVPVLLLLFVVTVVGPRFNRLLQTADAAPSAGDAPAASPSGQVRRGSISTLLGGLVTRSSTQLAVFELIWCLCKRDRYFKMRAYPTLVMPFLFSMGMLMSGRTSLSEGFHQLPATQKHLILLYAASAMISSVLMQIRYSDKFEAAWVYFAMPISAPGEILSATLKAVMMRFVVPGFLLVSVPVLAVWGWRVLPDIAVALCATLFISVLDARWLSQALPFSVGLGTMDASGRFGRSMLMMGVPAMIGLAHFILTYVPFALAPAGVVLLAGAWLLERGYRNTSWAALRSAQA